jgi:tetratricopeptide (TPR) repeat protein
LREYRKVCELRRDDPEPRRKIAEILEELGRVTDAGEAWMTLGELSVQQRDLGRALEAWQETVRLQPVNKEARRKLAEAYAFRSDTDEAVKEYLALARLHHKDGEHRRAAEYCQRVLSIDARNKVARAFLERMVSNGEAELAGESLVGRREGLGPVESAVQGALAGLAEALLGEAELVQPTVGTEVDGLESQSEDSPEIAAVLGRAVDSHSRGEIDEALNYYEQAVQLGVSQVEVLFNLGLLYRERSRFEEAIKLLQKSLEVSEYRLPSHLALGDCHWSQGEADRALDHFLQALMIIDLDFVGQDRADELTRSYQAVSDSHRGQGDGRQTQVLVHALTELLIGSDWKSRVSEARRKLDSMADEGTTSILPQFLELPGGDELLDIMVRSREYLRNDTPFTALEECYRAIQMAPTYLPLHLRLAEIFARQGKSEEAVSKYASVADAYLMRDNPRKAIGVYGRALQAAPMSTSIREKLIDLLIKHDEIDLALDEYMSLGESYYRLARVDTALEKYEEALGLLPRTANASDWEVRILHSVADLHMQRVHWKRALAIYEKITQLSPSDEQARVRLLELQWKLGNEEIALKELDALIVHFGKQRDFQKITNTLQELVAANPQDISLRSRLSRIYIELGRTREAIVELDTLGELQLEAGRKGDAMETLQTIISLEPHEKEGYTQLLRELGEETKRV